MTVRAEPAPLGRQKEPRLRADSCSTEAYAGDYDIIIARRGLSLWDRDLAVAFLGDLAILEVALRNAMSAQLELKWGAEWYKNLDMPLDDRSTNALSTAWNRIKEPKTPGKLVA